MSLAFPVTPSSYVVQMDEMKLIHTTRTENLMAMTNRQLEAWFNAGGLAVEVVSNCQDTGCPDCFTIEPAQTAA